MKKIIYLQIAASCFLFSCGNGHSDPVKNAKKENAKMIDSQLEKEQPVDSIAMMVSKQDADFLVNASSGGRWEVALGKLAQTQSNRPRVKDFGAMMVKDHAESGELLKSLASSRNITIPDSVSNRQRRQQERLQKMKSDAFDASYINLMVDDHKADIKEFEKEVNDGSNAAIKAFASDHLNMLRKHLDSATSLQRVVIKTVPMTPVVPGPY